MHVLLLKFWSRLQLFVGRMGRNNCYSVSFVWQSVKHALSMHNATSHFTHLDLTVRVTTRSEHTRHRLLFGLRPGHFLLWRVSNLIHNDFTYLVPRQLTSQFSTRKLTTFHFVNKKNKATNFNNKLSTVNIEDPICFSVCILWQRWKHFSTSMD